MADPLQPPVESAPDQAACDQARGRGAPIGFPIEVVALANQWAVATAVVYDIGTSMPNVDIPMSLPWHWGDIQQRHYPSELTANMDRTAITC